MEVQKHACRKQSYSKTDRSRARNIDFGSSSAEQCTRPLIHARRPKKLMIMGTTTPPATLEKTLPEAVPAKLSAKSTSAFWTDRLSIFIVIYLLCQHMPHLRRTKYGVKCRRWFGIVFSLRKVFKIIKIFVTATGFLVGLEVI